MIALLKVIFMAIVQGLSEFLPISSSGHLVFTSHIVELVSGNVDKIKTSYDIVLSMMLHVGTLIAVFIYFWKDISEIVKSFVNGIKSKKYDDYNTQLGFYVLWSTIATVIIALILNPTAETLMGRPAVVGFMLIITGCVLFFSEKLGDTQDTKENKITLRTAIIMGLAQGIAVLPGFSRSGWTIASGLLTGTNRVACAKYSFIMSLPIILCSSIVYPLVEVDMSEILSYNWKLILLGTIISAIVGYICIKYFMAFLSKYSLKVFGYYCMIVGFIATLVFTFI